MPIYSYRCSQCGQIHEQHNTVANRANGPTCCGAATDKMLTACMVQVPGGIDVNYRCQITGEIIQSMRKRQYIMDKHGMVDARDLKDTWARNEAAHKQELAEVKAAQDKVPEHVRKAAQAVAMNPPAGA